MGSIGGSLDSRIGFRVGQSSKTTGRSRVRDHHQRPAGGETHLPRPAAVMRYA
jgi:hypothetical protein